MRNHKKEQKVTLPGGGTRSAKSFPFHLVPPDGLRRTAKRFGLGAEKHGAFNWTRSCETEPDALVWARMAYDHMQEHMLKMAAQEDPEDDHLGAIGWAQSVLCYIEARFGKPWTELEGSHTWNSQDRTRKKTSSSR